MPLHTNAPRRPLHARGLSSGLVAVAAVIVIAIGGCGGSSKPSYCSHRSDLENSIKGLANLNVSSGLSGLQAQLQKVQTDANALVTSAKNDFPSQSSAVKSSIDKLVADVKALPSAPSATQIASLAGDATSVVNAAKSFIDATSSKC